jgi:hypothetical protein
MPWTGSPTTSGAAWRCLRSSTYIDEDKRIMAAVARHMLAIVEVVPAGNVVNLR